MGKWYDPEMEGFDLGFDAIQPGKYILQVEEGIEKYENEDTGSISLRIPFTAVDTKDEDLEDNIGKKISMFQNIVKKDGKVNKFGEKIVANVLILAGVGEHIDDKFDDDVDITDEDLLEEIKKCLPGRMVIGEIKMGKDMKGNDRPELNRIEKYPKQKPFKPGKKSKAKPKDDESDEWED